MKLEIAPEVLRDLTAWAVRATPRKPTIPVYNCIRLTATMDGVLTAAATDGWVYHSATGECIPGEAGEVLVPGRLLAQVVASLPRRNVTLTGGEHDGVLKLECGAAHFTFPVLPAADHPQMPDVPFEGAQIGGQVLSDALKAVLPAIDTGHEVAALCGMQFVVHEGKATCTGTNRFRLATCTVPAEAAAGTFSLIIPADALTAVASMAAEVPAVTVLLDSDPGFGDGPQVAGFIAGNRTMVTRTLGGQYMDWEAVLHKAPPPPHTAAVDAEAMNAAVRRVAEMMTSPKQSLRLTWRAGHVRLVAGEGDQAGQDSVPVEWVKKEGQEADAHPEQELQMYVNPQYLLDGLDAAQAPTVHVQLWGPLLVVRIIPEPAERLTDTLYFMQPIRPGAGAAVAAAAAAAA